MKYEIEYSTVMKTAPAGSMILAIQPPTAPPQQITVTLISNGIQIARILSTGRPSSTTVPISAIAANSLQAVIDYTGADAPSTIPLTISTPGLLDGVTLTITLVELPDDSTLQRAAAAVPASHYYTGFETSGMYYFLSYIPWIKRHYVQAEPPKQGDETTAHESMHSCIFSEGVFGQSYIDTIDLGVAADAEQVWVSFWWKNTAVPVGKAFDVVAYFDGKEFARSGVQYGDKDDQGWMNPRLCFNVPQEASTFSVSIEALTFGTYGTIAYIDDLSINFIRQTMQATDYGARFSGGYISIPNNAAYMIGTGDFTFEAWIKPSQPGPILGKKSTEGGDPSRAGFLFQVNPNGVITPVTDNGFGYCLLNSVGTSAFDGKWHHIAATRANKVMSVYFDGWSVGGTIAESVEPPLNISNSLPLLIGSVQQQQQIYRFYQGMLNEVRLWNIARSQWDILATMNRCLTGKEDGLIGYWILTDATAHDYSRIQNNGQIQGAVTFIEQPGDLVEVTVGKYPAGGMPLVDYFGDHTFVAVMKPGSQSYPADVDVYFDAGGGHIPPSGEAVLNTVTVRGNVNELIRMCVGNPVGPKKNIYGNNRTQGELCNLVLEGFRNTRTGVCQHVCNRLLYAATWPNRMITLGNAQPGMSIRAYWLVTAIWGIYGGETWSSPDPHGTAFRRWCAQNGFPQPPLDDEVRYGELLFLDSGAREKAVAAFEDFARAMPTVSANDADLLEPRRALIQKLARVLEPEELYKFSI